MKPPADDEEDDEYDQYENDGFEESKQGSVAKQSSKAAGLGLLESTKQKEVDIGESGLEGQVYSQLKARYEEA